MQISAPEDAVLKALPFLFLPQFQIILEYLAAN
jgi:hypothetical protein